MGNAMSCFDRWGKRAPDGALFAPKKSDGDVARSPSAFSAPMASASTAASTGGTAGQTKSKVGIRYDGTLMCATFIFLQRKIAMRK